MNQLPSQNSPYLQQHAHQSIAWQPWGDAAAALAKQSGKLLFISIGYSACHWCHVMSHDSFDQADVAAALNADFVAIKVDREEFPEVDRYYMDAVQAMQGQGGWPLTVVATPDGVPVWGGTFLWRPQLLQVLGQLTKAWRADPAGIRALGARVVQALQAAPRAVHTPETAGEPAAAWTAALRQLRERFDPVHGGFGGAPKFPSSASLMLLAREYGEQRDTNLLPQLTLTCDAMFRGGIYDHLGGGFHRYATDQAWHVPHFEKMLYDNALLTLAYIDAAAVTHAPHYHWIVHDLLWYAQRDLQHPDGPFFTAEDADSAGEEGAMYVWTLAELEAALPEEYSTQAKYWWQATKCGNWESGKNILHLRGDVAWETLSSDVYYHMRTQLLAARNMRERPLRDDKVLVGQNGLMIAAFARAAMVTGEQNYIATAQRAAQWLLTQCCADDDTVARVWCRGATQWGGCAADYAYLIWGLLELASADGDAAWVRRAAAIADACNAQLWSEADGGYWFAPADPRLAVRDCDWEDGALPSSNAIMALNLARLGAVLNHRPYTLRSEQLVRNVLDATQRHPLAGTTGVWVAHDIITHPTQVVIVGHASDPLRATLVATAQQCYQPGMHLVWGAPGDLPLFSQKGTRNGNAAAHVCRGTTCLAPISDPAQLRAVLDGGNE